MIEKVEEIYLMMKKLKQVRKFREKHAKQKKTWTYHHKVFQNWDEGVLKYILIISFFLQQCLPLRR
jgi:hypothetical protein